MALDEQMQMLQGVAWHAMTFFMIGVVAAWLGCVCAGLEQQFIPSDHSHADNH
jgi:hypothetical protein